MEAEPVRTTILSRIRAFLFPHAVQPRYRVIDRSTGETLQETDLWGRYQAVESLISEGWSWETLDIIDDDGRAAFHREGFPDYGSLAIARTVPNAMVVATTTWGGDEIMFTCPAALVTCDERRLDQLVNELDALCWGSDGELSPMTWFVPPDPAIAEEWWGLQGGYVERRLWVSPRISQVLFSDPVWDVLSGVRDELRDLRGNVVQR